MSESPANNDSRGATPNPRFVTQAATAEDVLKSQGMGLVQLADYKKRRAEALESSLGTPAGSGASTPANNSVSSPPPPAKKKKTKRKDVARGKLSFAVEDGDEDTDDNAGGTAAATTPRTATPALNSEASDADSDGAAAKRTPRVGPNTHVAFAPKAATKSALLREAQQRELLRREFLAVQQAVKATEVVIPFVFYDGTNIPGGRCRVKKGDQIWLFLDKARKVGAEIGVGGDRGRREWARVSVDDLILVRNELILPHHYDFYYFLINKSVGYESKRILDYSAERTGASPVLQQEGEVDLATYDPLARPKHNEGAAVRVPEQQLEGFDDEPSITKVVDRRWYERNKHIFPASVWEEFDATKDYSKAHRKDTEGNSFFFS